MSGQLLTFISPVISPLEDMQRQLTQLVTLHRDSQTRLRLQCENLIIASGPDPFTGRGADAFSQAVDQYITTSENRLHLLEVATSAINTCINEITRAATASNYIYLDQYILSQVLAMLNYREIILYGGDAVMSVLREMVNTFAAMEGHAVSFLGHMLTETVQGISVGVNNAEHLAAAAWNILGEITRVLYDFAWAVYYAVYDLQNIMRTFPVPVPTLLPIIRLNGSLSAKDKRIGAGENFGRNPNLNTLYNLIGSTERTDTPITIRKMGNDQGGTTILVTLAGLDLNPSHQDYLNNFSNAIDAGLGDPNNPYVLETRKTIEEYIRSHNLPPGTKVIIAGHSLGGMVGEILAANQGNTDYHIDKVITYGSPQLLHDSSVNYQQYFTKYDTVTLLTPYEYVPTVEGILANSPSWDQAVYSIYKIYMGDWQAKEIFLNEIYVPDAGNDPNPGFLDHFMKDHRAYGGSNWLKQPIMFNQKPIAPIGPIEFYSDKP